MHPEVRNRESPTVVYLVRESLCEFTVTDTIVSGGISGVVSEVAGFNSFDALSLLGVIAIVIVGMAIGWEHDSRGQAARCSTPPLR